MDDGSVEQIKQAARSLRDSANTGATAEAEGRSAQDWVLALSHYRKPSNGRAAFELIVTIVPLFGLWAVMWVALDISVWLTLALAVPTSGFLLRMFLIQHDCGHGSFFRSRALNDWVGRAIGVLTLTPYWVWRRAHALHHAGSGSLERRGHGDIDTITVSEYRARSRLGRFGYWLYRQPIVLFGIGPAYQFFLHHRLPVGFMRQGWRPWLSAMGTNVMIALVATGVIWLAGLQTYLLVYLPVALLAASIGIWLFYVQHQFEETLWDTDETWNWHEAALRGSSYFELPGPLRWLTANIGTHHVHHLVSRIPFYRLPQVIQDFPELRNVARLTFKESFACIRLTLWDETSRRLVSFREARAIA
ncbi:MAG: fatty acid desaturase [Pseudomonadota bacterium]